MPITEHWERGRRVNASMEVVLSVVLAKTRAYYVMETKNLSYGGVCLKSDQAFPSGTQLRLVFGQPPDLPRFSLEGIVRWSEGGKGIGVEFTSLSAQDEQALLEFVNSHYPSGHA